MISVILPVYRVEKYIKACIQSLLGQTYRDFEVILVDDGSPDCSAEIAENLLYTEGSIPFQIIHTENRGVSAARNTGLEQARGEYVVMVDSDDVLSPVFLQEYSDMMARKPGLDIYSSDFRVVDENSWESFAPIITGEEILRWDEAQTSFFERKIRFLLPTLLISRYFLVENAIYFDEAVRYSEDVQFIWRCLAHNRKLILHSKKKLYNYILHPGSTMTASGISKILTCRDGIDRLFTQVGELFCPEVRDQLVARTCFSMLHSAAKMMDLARFCQLYEQARCESQLQAQARNGSIKIRFVAAILLFSKKTGYQIMRKF